MRCFVLEDDEILSEIIEEFLIEQGHSVVVCRDGLKAEETLMKERFDLLLLDVQVPYISGFELLQSLRELQNHTPAIFITALNHSKDLKHGFKVGADDYIRKPFDLDELEARIANVTKYNRADDEIAIPPHFLFYPKRYMLRDSINNNLLELTKKEAEILLLFVQNPNRILSVQEIILNIWSYDSSPSENTLRGYIKNLRRYLGFDRITNIKGSGYRFNTI